MQREWSSYVLLTTSDSALFTGIDDSRAPYSKSHARRVKRKSREQLAGGMNDLESVLHTLAADDPAIVPANDIKTGRPDSKPKAKQIGEGKGATLSEKQRKKQLYVGHDNPRILPV